MYRVAHETLYTDLKWLQWLRLRFYCHGVLMFVSQDLCICLLSTCEMYTL
jgi:hypothetical protein